MVNVQALGIDLGTIVGHKFGAPKGWFSLIPVAFVGSIDV